ncbi:TlpA family protein disulfide reductase [Pseudoalteromonas xiamenensis]
MLLRQALLIVLCVFKTAIVSAQTKEYVFINIWDEYQQPTALPIPLAPRTILQPDLNIDTASLQQFKASFPDYANLNIDSHNQLMRTFGVRQTPYRVIVEDGTVVKREALTPVLASSNHVDEKIPLQTLSGKSFAINHVETKYRVLFLSDSLCPFHHLPNCEARVKQNNELASASIYPVITIIKPFYVDIQNARDYQQRFQVQQEIVFDHHNEVFRQFDVHELPYWLVQNQQGQVIYRGNKMPTLPALFH